MNLTKPVLILDVDGVLLSWMANLPLFCRSVGLSTKVALQAYSSPVHYDARDLFGTSDLSQAIRLIEQYNTSRYGRYLPAYADAVPVIPRLAEKYTIVCLSAFGSSTEAWLNRRGNLEAFFPECISDLVLVGPGESKKAKLAELLRVYEQAGVVAFVDDQDNYIEQAKDVVAGMKYNTKVIKLNRDTDQTDIKSFFELEALLA